LRISSKNPVYVAGLLRGVRPIGRLIDLDDAVDLVLGHLT
jgi:hypothetical protein